MDVSDTLKKQIIENPIRKNIRKNATNDLISRARNSIKCSINGAFDASMSSVVITHLLGFYFSSMTAVVLVPQQLRPQKHQR
jgi:hypothetical protein